MGFETLLRIFFNLRNLKITVIFNFGTGFQISKKPLILTVFCESFKEVSEGEIIVGFLGIFWNPSKICNGITVKR
jgi:hypothetical protein